MCVCVIVSRGEGGWGEELPAAHIILVGEQQRAVNLHLALLCWSGFLGRRAERILFAIRTGYVICFRSFCCCCCCFRALKTRCVQLCACSYAACAGKTKSKEKLMHVTEKTSLRESERDREKERQTKGERRESGSNLGTVWFPVWCVSVCSARTGFARTLTV